MGLQITATLTATSLQAAAESQQQKQAGQRAVEAQQHQCQTAQPVFEYILQIVQLRYQRV
jgi:hypothetical protein